MLRPLTTMGWQLLVMCRPACCPRAPILPPPEVKQAAHSSTPCQACPTTAVRQGVSDDCCCQLPPSRHLDHRHSSCRHTLARSAAASSWVCSCCLASSASLRRCSAAATLSLASCTASYAARRTCSAGWACCSPWKECMGVHPTLSSFHTTGPNLTPAGQTSIGRWLLLVTCRCVRPCCPQHRRLHRAGPPCMRTCWLTSSSACRSCGSSVTYLHVRGRGACTRACCSPPCLFGCGSRHGKASQACPHVADKGPPCHLSGA